ncbi:MAG: hypothetical protein LBE25_12540 [Arthrobacter sp.]|jgi:hypothetical protein|nr:hypothetical protein [Arthrobacter sp.]
MASAWNLGFEVEGGLAKDPGGKAEVPVPEHAPSGWAGTDGPNIPWENWPRHKVLGLPLMHLVTLFLPEEYRRKGPEYVGVAFFAAGGESDPEATGESQWELQDGPAWEAFNADLTAAVESEQTSYRLDVLGGPWALVWLTQEQIEAGPTPPHADPRPEAARGEIEYGDGENAWDSVSPTTRIWLLPREDPNAGVEPVEYAGDEDEYEDPYPDGDEAPWAGALFGWSHLGGTVFNVQALPEGLSPWYLEFEEFGHLNLGDAGTLQVDLETDVLDWACG